MPHDGQIRGRVDRSVPPAALRVSRSQCRGKNNGRSSVSAPTVVSASLVTLCGGTLAFAGGEFQSVRAGVNHHPAAVAYFARQELAPERGFQLALEHAAQRTRTVNWIVAVLGEVIAGAIGQLQFDLALLQPLAE